MMLAYVQRAECRRKKCYIPPLSFALVASAY